MTRKQHKEKLATMVKYLQKNCCASLKEMARHFKLHKNTIRWNLEKTLGMSFTDFRQSLFHHALTEYLRQRPHATLREIAGYFQINTRPIWDYLRKNNIKRKSRVQIITDIALKDYIKSNPSATLEKIAKHFFVSPTTIWNLIRKFKIPYLSKLNSKTLNSKMTDDALADYIIKHPTASLSKIASHFKIAKESVRQRVKNARIPYKSKSKPRILTKDKFAHYVAEHPSATKEELAEHFGVDISTVKRWKLKCLFLIDEILLAKYIAEHPNANWQTLKEHFPVISIREHLPNGIPRQWTKEIVEDLLDELVLRLGDALTTTVVSIKKTKYLHRAFIRFELYKNYPLHYWRFDPLIYPLFGMDMPKDYEEELRMEWPSYEVLHKRYRELLKLHHPDRHNHNPRSAKIAHFKFHWVVKAYSHLLKRHKKLAIGEPPTSIIRSIVKNGGKLLSHEVEEKITPVP